MAFDQKQPPLALVILDGWGYSSIKEGNAIALANTPCFDMLWSLYPHALLKASGKAVGLPDDIMGNSEVGHLTIGSGTIIKQSSLLIEDALTNGAIEHNPILQQALTTLVKNKKRLHLLGLASDGFVHSNYTQFEQYLALAQKANVSETYIHAFLDGRDVPPKSAQQYLTQIDAMCSRLHYGKLASITGRFFAMDRDTHWERTCAAYSTLTEPKKPQWQSWQEALEYYYAHNSTDEFIAPTLLIEQGAIEPGDGVIVINFRADRARQLIQALIDQNRPCGSQIPLSFVITPVSYGIHAPGLHALLERKLPAKTLLDTLEENGLRIFSIAETEKYAHISYFFNGGKETKHINEERILIPSKRINSYADAPEMSAEEITQAVMDSLKNDPADFYLINYANADMVGHTGNLQATIKAIEFLDKQLSLLYEEIVQKEDGILLITADHGNAEEMIDLKTGQPKTAHTSNLVPFIYARKGNEHTSLTKRLVGLKDIASFIESVLFNPII